MHFCPGNLLHPETPHTIHVDPESKNAAHTKYLDPIPKTLKRSQLSQEFWRRWHMDSKKATQLVHYTLLLCISVLAYLCICGKEDPPSVTRSRFVTAAWLVVNDEAKLWNPIYSPLSHSTSETSSLLLWTRILLRLKRFLLTHFQQSSRVDFQLKKYQPFGKIQSVQNVLFWKFVKVFCLFGKI